MWRQFLHCWLADGDQPTNSNMNEELLEEDVRELQRFYITEGNTKLGKDGLR